MTKACEYLVPDYYPHFRCKMGACRTACCEGWPITVSMQDYFHLIGVECSPDLRRKLDCSLHLLEHPSPDAYAQISPRYDGRCPLRCENGLCAIHAELGEDSLSAVCRLYPRGVRTEGNPECSCANSCEAVLEQLFSRDEPISFRKCTLSFDLPEQPARTIQFETAGREQEIRLYLIQIMQDRTLSIPQRIIRLGFSLKALEEALSTGDTEEVDALLLGKAIPQILPDLPIDHEHLSFGLTAAEAMMKILDERSASVREYGETALAVFGEGESALNRYHEACRHFETTFPKWEIWFEHMLVNHMFFERFPFQDRPEGLYDEFIAICTVYAVLRFLCIGWMSCRKDPSDLIDVASAAFRLIDHTAFDRYSAHLLKELNCSRPEQLFDLIRL